MLRRRKYFRAIRMLIIASLLFATQILQGKDTYPMIATTDSTIWCPCHPVHCVLYIDYDIQYTYSVQWYKDNIALPGDTGMELPVEDTGYYSAQVRFRDHNSSGIEDVRLSGIFIRFYYVSHPEITLADHTFYCTSQDCYGYQWYCNNMPVDGGTFASIGPGESGYYKVLAHTSLTCGWYFSDSLYYDKPAVQFSFSGLTGTGDAFCATYSLPENEHCTFCVWDMNGRLLYKQEIPPGEKERFSFSKNDFASGIYIYRVFHNDEPSSYGKFFVN